jgi:hypothetical protein
MTTEFRTQEHSLSASTIFRVVSGTPTVSLASKLPRRERWLLLLVDGRRSITYLAHLTRRSEFDVASTLARFLQWGYIEPIATEKFQPNDFVQREFNSM